MSSTSSSLVKRELPFVAKLLVLCAVSATVGAVIAAYQQDGHVRGLQFVANRQLASVQRSFSLLTADSVSKAAYDPDTVFVNDFDHSEEEEQEEEEEEDSGDDDSEPVAEEDEDNDSEENRRQLLSWPFCKIEKTAANCRQRAMNLQVPCSWRNGNCKFRPGATIPQPPPIGEGATLAPTAPPAAVSNCLANTAQCPVYAPGRLLLDWPIRFTGNAACAPEKGFYNVKCLDVCETLFNSYSATVPWGTSILKACNIGCKYGKNMYDKGLQLSTCHADCKNTVWFFNAKAGKCRYPFGLGAAVTEGGQPEVLGAGKACEIGCLAANDRPCPALNKAVGWLP